MNIDINLLAVFVAAIASMVVGGLWYSPLLFGKKWMALTGKSASELSEMKKGAPMAYGASFILGLIMAYILAHFVEYVGAVTVGDALQLAIWVWLGFVATVQFTSVLFEKRSPKMFLINTGYQLASIVVMSLIIVLWA